MMDVWGRPWMYDDCQLRCTGGVALRCSYVWCDCSVDTCDVTHPSCVTCLSHCVTWPVHVWDVRCDDCQLRCTGGVAWRCSYVWHDSHPCVTCLTYCVTWLVHVCNMIVMTTSSWDVREALLCGVHTCDMTHTPCVTWHVHVCDMTHPSCGMTRSLVWHVSFMIASWNLQETLVCSIQKCDVTRWLVWHDPSMIASWTIRETKLVCSIHTGDMTHPLRDMTRSCAWHHSFMPVTWDKW